MAELDDKLLKTLDQTLQNMNTHLQNLESTLRGVKGGIDATFNPAIIKSFSDGIRGLKAARIIDADKSVAEVNKIYSKIQDLSYMVKTGMKLEPMSIEQLEKYRQRLEEIEALLEPITGKKLKGQEWFDRRSLQRERDQIRDILDSESPVIPVPLKKEEIAAAVELLKRYEEVYKNIRKGDQQRAVEIANIAAKERAADMQTAEAAVSQREQAERRKAEIARAWAEQEAREKAQREKMKTASEKAVADERTAIAEAEAKKKSEIAKAWAEQDRRRYEKDGDPLGEIAARKGLTGTLAALEDQTAVNEWRKQTAEEQKRIAKEEAEVEKQIKKEMAEEEKKLAAEEKQRYQDAVAANKAMTKAEDDLAEAKRKARTAESKSAYTEDTKQRIEEERKAARERAQQAKEAAAIQKKADAESMANQRRQIQIKSQLAAIDKNRIAITKQSSDREKALAAQQQADYRSLQSELSKLIARQKELNAVSQGSGRRAKDRLSTYTISESEKAMRRYADAVKNAQKEQKKLGDETNKMLPTIQRLASAFGVAFSVRGLAQFGKKLIETRGEFEMQFVAMKQIIGDVDAATKIWNQTLQQALQSPFKAMQLVTYTKNLAAYRIETEKLFDTTKRLADVSAGLGVDMGRLILAFGQVKSANFLRASEVRQFTEAGVNIVGNLAQYFTKLEGRAVSTADVMERITKRMVMFSDVEEIFRRMTDEGGEFYKMQEIQADTVKGQINKLHDAYDQMLNTIGQANQGTLRNYIESLNELVRNWRTVASFIMKNVNAMVVLVPLIATYRKGAKMAAGETFTWSRAMKQLELELAFGRAGIKKFSLSTALGTAAVYTFKGAVELTKMALRTFVPFIAIEGLMWLVTKMGEADRNAKELAKSLDEVGSKNAASLQENIDGFTDLVERLKQANEGSQDYLDIRNKIQSQYGEYLDNLELEQITVENLAKSYDKVVERMREKSRQHIMEEGLQEIAEAYGDALVKFQKELKGTKLPNGMKVNDKEAADIAKKMYDLYSKDEFYRSDGSAGLLLGKVLRDYYGVSGELNLSLKTAKDFQKAIESRYKSQINLETKANALTKATSDTHKEYLDQLNAEEEHEKKIAEILADASIKSSGRRELAIQAEQLRYEEKKLELQAQYQKKSDEWLKNEKAKLKENYGAFLNAYNEQVKAYIGGRFGEGWMQGDNKDAWKAYNFMIANQDRLSQGQTKWEEKILNDKKLTEENIQRIKEQQATQTAADSEAAKALNESLKQEEDRLELIKKQMELLGLHEKQKGGSGSANNSIYGERIRLLQDMLQKYKQLAKEAYGYAKAEGKVSESFEDAWNSIMPAGYGELEVPTSYKALAEMLQRLEAFTPAFDKNGQLSKMLADLKKAVSDALSQVDIELSVRIREDFGKQMEKAFGDYELTLDIEKLNLPSDVLADMFDIESVDLAGLRKKIEEGYERLRGENGGNIDETDRKNIEGYIKKIDDMERKQQRERIKDYAKYLEYEMSERAKITMEYVRKISDVQAETTFSSKQKDRIVKGLTKEMNEKLAKQDWEDFKGSEVYVQMMEDLEKHGSAALVTMRKELEKIRDNAENLSPRALKEVVNALAKIKEIELNRSNPFTALNQSRVDMQNAISKANAKSREEVYAEADAIEKLIVEEQDRKRELDNIVSAKKEGLRIEEELSKLYSRHNILDYAVTSADNDALVQSNVNALQAAIKANVNEIENLQTERAREGTTEERVRQIDEEIGSIIEETNQYREQKEILEKILQLRISLGLIDKNAIQDEDAEQRQAESETKLENLAEEQRRYQEAVDAIDRYNAQVQRAMQFVDEWAGKVQGLWGEISNLSTAYEGEFGDWVAKWGNVIDVSLSQVSKLSKAFADFRKTRADYLKSAVKKTTDKVSNAAETAQTATTTLATNAETEAITSNTLAKTENAVASNLAATGNTAVGTTATAATPAVATFGATLLMAMGWVGLIIAALEALFVIIKAIAGANDEGIDQEIEDSKDKVDKLTKAYERLEKQIEKTWDTVSYMREYNEEVQNLYEQIEEANNQIAAAQGYKNEDKKKEAIEAAEDAKQEALDALDEIKQKQIEVFGGIGEDNYRSAAEGFVDAWKSAFLETGDGLQGLQDHFDEFLQDWFVKQATMQGVATYYQKVFDYINGVVEGGNVPTAQDIENARALADEAAIKSDELMQAYAQIFGLGGEGSLSGLAAGIQGMTEEQANILEAYWNSVRGYTASIDMNVATIVGLLSNGTGVGGGRGVDTNPQLVQLEAIAGRTNDIYKLLDGLRFNGGEGLGFRVYSY